MNDDSVLEALKLRQKYQHFRVLVIGRANAGKTTLLKRVCNTLEEPCIYDEKGQQLLEPTSDRGVHDVDIPFAFRNMPGFIFHDSCGFEAGGRDELTRVLHFIQKRAKATEVGEQLHAVWFCLGPDISRPLHALEKEFFNMQLTGNVPVIAIFTKFDTLCIKVKISPKDRKAKKHEKAIQYLGEYFQKPLESCAFPPKAYLRLEDMQNDHGNHQEQVKELMQKTTDSLDDPTLKLLFVSIQSSNLELCIEYAVKYSSVDWSVMGVLQWFCHAYYEDYDYGATEEDDGAGAAIIDIRRGADAGIAALLSNCRTVERAITSSPLGRTFPSRLETFAALIICTEHSFWVMYKSHAAFHFVQAFQDACDKLTEDIGKVAHLKATLAKLPDDQMQSHWQKFGLLNEWKMDLIKIILENCLSK